MTHFHFHWKMYLYLSHSITGDPRATAAEAKGKDTCVTRRTAEANEAPDPGDPVALSERANCEREREPAVQIFPPDSVCF